jgi:anti-anti-sigma regulatory factor
MPTDEQGMAVGEILISPTGSTVTITLTGDIGTGMAGRLRPALINIIMHRRPNRIVIDLRAVTAIEAEVIGTLRAARDLAQDVNLSLAFESAGSPVATMIVDTELDGTAPAPAAASLRELLAANG